MAAQGEVEFFFSPATLSAMNFSFPDIVSRRTTPGVLILNERHEVLHCNQEALEALSPLHAGPAGKAFVPGEVTRLCEELRLNQESASYAAASFCVEGGGRGGGPAHYALRAFSVNNPIGVPTSIMVLIEPIALRREPDLERVRQVYALSKRELQVLQRVCRGLSNQGIAEQLFISEYTVKDHIKSIMKRLGVKSRCQIIAAVVALRS